MINLKLIAPSEIGRLGHASRGSIFSTGLPVRLDLHQMISPRLVLLMLARTPPRARNGAIDMASPQELQGKQNGADVGLWLSTIAFTACFAVWTIFSIIGVQIKENLGLSETQFGLLVGTPILTGSLIRLVLGVWTEQFGGHQRGDPEVGAVRQTGDEPGTH